MTIDFRKKDNNSTSSYKWGTGEEADSIRTMNSKELIDKGERNIKVLKNNILFSLKSSKVISIDYISIANAETLEELEILSCKNVLVSIAVYIRKIRLIDNYSYSFK